MWAELGQGRAAPTKHKGQIGTDLARGGGPGLGTWTPAVGRTWNVLYKLSRKQCILTKFQLEACPCTLASKEEWGYFSVLDTETGSVCLK